jgi:hypothetical protein
MGCLLMVCAIAGGIAVMLLMLMLFRPTLSF